MAMLLWALACALAHALADKDASCMLQAKKAQVAGSLTQKQKPKPEFCKQGTAELNFESFEHGDRIAKNSIRAVAIEAKPRGKICTGPLLVLDTTKETIEEDLQKCGKSKLLIYSQDGDRNNLKDCNDIPGPVVTFTFWKLQDIESVDLCDQEAASTIKVYNKKGRLIKAVKGPSGGGQDGKNANVVVKERGVRKLEIELGGAGDAIRRITACKPRASVFGDPHIYTLDGGKFDLYQNGTFTVFHYSGQKVSDSGKGAASSEVDWQLYAHYGGPRWTVQGLLLVDRSLGRFRQALELTAKDCQWRSRGEGSSWSEMKKKQSLSLLEDGNYVTGFNYFSEKHIDLQMNTPAGVKDTLTLNTVCKPSGINMRISMPDMAEHRFLTGQIEVGNAEQQQLFAVTKAWESLGGSGATASYLQQLQGEQYSLVTSCSEEEREQAEKVCATHLGEHLLDAEGPDADFFQDCIFDVCRGGEEFAVAAAELLSAA